MDFITANWPAPANIHAYTTTRTGFADKTDKQKLQQLFSLPQDPIWLTQVHGTEVVVATPENTAITADASYTNTRNQPCVILTADCLPVLICNKQGTHIAAIHAGWRGLVHGIIERTIHTLNLPTTDLLVWLGPAIGPTKFEVGEDVFTEFTQHSREAESAFTSMPNNKWLANLYTLARQRLNALGVNNISGGDYCTYSQDNLFFSYRRDKGATGRMASVIWIT